MTEQVLLCRAELEEMIQLSRSQIYSLMKRGRFPQPLKLGEGPRAAVRWRYPRTAWPSDSWLTSPLT